MESTACTGGATETISWERLASALRSLEDLPRCPFAQYMDSRGMPPEAGYVLYLPMVIRAQAGPFPPRYVVFGENVPFPMIGVDFRPSGRVPFQL